MLRSLVRIPVFGFFGSEFLDLIFDKDFFGNIYLGENARRAHGFCARAACDFEERLSTSVIFRMAAVSISFLSRLACFLPQSLPFLLPLPGGGHPRRHAASCITM